MSSRSCICVKPVGTRGLLVITGHSTYWNVVAGAWNQCNGPSIDIERLGLTWSHSVRHGHGVPKQYTTHIGLRPLEIIIGTEISFLCWIFISRLKVGLHWFNLACLKRSPFRTFRDFAGICMTKPSNLNFEFPILGRINATS